jgi:hypothetical protein
MLIDSFHHEIANSLGFCVVKGIRMDAPRLACDFLAALVANIDETGHQECVDLDAE